MENFKISYIQLLRPQEARLLYLLSTLHEKNNAAWYTLQELFHMDGGLNPKSVWSKAGKWCQDKNSQHLLTRRYRTNSPLFEYHLTERGFTWVSRIPSSLIKQFDAEIASTTAATALDRIQAKLLYEQEYGHKFN